ncbi:MAG: hypothetical protein A4E32_01335 [Methanomassiliicoccales archaeon PtaU1.Bin124]|nr:MAG: hypothetical protein A4E32_01335 [Methanomassiliicoccales archaeon PtaU1.Bin124]
MHHLIGNTLHWTQPGLSRVYELKAGEKIFGRLTFQSIFGSLASAETAEGNFTLKRQGFLQPSISLRRFGSDLDQGRMLMDGWHQGGVLHLADGSRYQFVKMGFLHPEWSFLDSTGRKLACVHVKWGFKYQGEVTIEPFGRDDRNLLQLLMVGMYAIILMNDEAAAAAAN